MQKSSSALSKWLYLRPKSGWHVTNPLLFSRVVRRAAKLKHLKQICSYWNASQILETSYCNICPWHLKQRQFLAGNCINLCHRAECFIPPPAEDRVHAGHQLAGTLKQTAHHHPLGKDLKEKPTEQSIFVIIYASFQSRSKLKRRMRKKMLGTLDKGSTLLLRSFTPYWTFHPYPCLKTLWEQTF